MELFLKLIKNNIETTFIVKKNDLWTQFITKIEENNSEILKPKIFKQ